MQAGGEVLEPGLVVDADERPADRRPVDRSAASCRLHADSYLSAGHGEAVTDHPADRVDEHLPLDRLDARVQHVLVVAGQHRDLTLRKDRAGVHTRVDEEQRGTARRDACRECLPDAVHAREQGQQRGMGVDGPAGEAAEEIGPGEL